MSGFIAGSHTFFIVIKRKPLGTICAAIIFVMAVGAIFAGEIASHDPLEQNISKRLSPPGREHFFGSDSFGRDTFSRVVYGARVSLYVGTISVAIAAALGSVIGIISAYVGGKFDMGLQRGVDAFLAFPSLVLALVLVASLGASVSNVIIAITTAITPQMVRLSRSLAMVVKEEDYVLAAQSVGCLSTRTIFRHILPNCLAPLVVQASGYLEQAVVAEAALSFLGLGVPPPHSSWGRMLHEGAQGYLEVAPWLTLFPGLALSLAVLCFSLAGDAMRDLLDPHISLRAIRKHG